MRQKLVAVFFGVVALACLNPAHAAPIPLGSSFELTAESDAGGGSIIDVDKQSQAGTLNPLNASVSATATFGGASVFTTGTGSATWDDSSRGLVRFSNIGWDTQHVMFGRAIIRTGGPDAGIPADPNWTYTFIADVTGLFTVDYGIEAFGSDIFGLGIFRFTGIGEPIDLTPTPNGTIMRSIVAGQTYTAGIRSISNVSGPLGTRVARTNGTFDFRMQTAEVPESSTLTLFGVGSLVLICYSCRRWKQERLRETFHHLTCCF